MGLRKNKGSGLLVFRDKKCDTFLCRYLGLDEMAFDSLLLNKFSDDVNNAICDKYKNKKVGHHQRFFCPPILLDVF